MIIRQAKVKDVHSLHHLILSATKRGKVLKRSEKDIRKCIRQFWIIEISEKIVACCALEIYNKKLAEMRSLVVDPHYLGQGLGSQLVAQIIQIAKKKKIYELMAITDRENIFKRLGFSEQLQEQKALFLRP